MAAIDAERYLDHLPVEMPAGDEITIEGEHVTADRREIILPSGEVVRTSRNSRSSKTVHRDPWGATLITLNRHCQFQR
jgi:hypothetical protein